MARQEQSRTRFPSQSKEMIKLVAIGLLSIVFSGCAGILPPPQPLDHRSAGIAIHITEVPPAGLWFKRIPGRIHFIRLDDIDSTSFIKNSVISSNYSRDGYIYLLNVPPGRYAAVASLSYVSTTKYNYTYSTYYSGELAKLTEIEVQSGEIAFMGRFLVNTPLGLKGADDVQVHYFRLMAPGAENRNEVLSLLFPPGDFHYKGDLLEAHQSDEGRAEFAKKAKVHFKDSGWYDLLHEAGAGG